MTEYSIIIKDDDYTKIEEFLSKLDIEILPLVCNDCGKESGYIVCPDCIESDGQAKYDDGKETGYDKGYDEGYENGMNDEIYDQAMIKQDAFIFAEAKRLQELTN